MDNAPVPCGSWSGPILQTHGHRRCRHIHKPAFVHQVAFFPFAWEYIARSWMPQAIAKTRTPMRISRQSRSWAGPRFPSRPARAGESVRRLQGRESGASELARLYRLAALSLMIWGSGCAVTGTWTRLATVPPETTFPFEHITFGDGRDYTSTTADRRQTTIGQYEGNASRLTLRPAGMNEPVIRGRRRFDGKLVLWIRESGREVRGVFQQTAPAESAGGRDHQRR